MVFCLIGPPGSGKDTQANILAQKYDVKVVSPGEVLREVVQKQGFLASKIESYTDQGKLVPDEIVDHAIRDYLEDLKPKNIVFTGFPRRVGQVKSLEGIVQDLGQKLVAVILMQIPDEIVADRISGRLYAPKADRFYHERYHKPRVPGVDDETGEPLIRRDDDTPEAARQRLEIHKETMPAVIEEFTKRGVLYRMEATGDVREVEAKIGRIMNKFLTPKN